MRSLRAAAFVALLAALLAGCAGPGRPGISIEEGRTRVMAKLPADLSERSQWAADIHAAMEALQVELSAGNICAVVAVTEQESGFKVDPVVPGLAAAAWKELEAKAERAGIPSLVVQSVLSLSLGSGRSYRERIDAARTERELSDIFEDFIGKLPLGRSMLEDHNPIRTGGPMQVSIAFAKQHAEAHKYPYPVQGSIRHEVFSRRGGMYFGIAHLLGYPAPYDRYLYRFADFNAGHYASRNAAFQKALGGLARAQLALDGDLLRYEDGRPAAAVSATESAARSIAAKLELTPEQIRRDLVRGTELDFGGTPTYARVFRLADAAEGKPVPRAVIPQILLQSSKFTRKLTTEWFATRVVERHRRCMSRS